MDERHLADVVARSFASMSDLDTLCSDIPIFPQYSSELFYSNDFYGNAEQLKRFLNLPSHYSLKAAVQHGNQYAGRHWDVEASTFLPVRLAWGDHIEQAWDAFCPKETYKISAPFCYTTGILSQEAVASEKTRLGRNLLLFPAHSNHNTTIKFDIASFLEQISDVTKNYDSVRVCIYWKDYLLNLHEPYESAGLECVTAGHMFDYNFLPRLRSLLEICDASASNRIGSFFGYSIYLNRPHVFFDQQLSIVDHGIKRVEEDEVLWRADPDVKKILEIFSRQDGLITAEHWDCLEPYFGFKEIKTTEQLRDIFIRAEELYRQQESHRNSIVSPVPEVLVEEAVSDVPVEEAVSDVEPELSSEVFDTKALQEELLEIKTQLAPYLSSKVIQGVVQLKNIYITRAWGRLPGWSLKVARFVKEKLCAKGISGSISAISAIEALMAKGDLAAAHAASYSLKAQGHSIRGLDMVRAKIFLARGEQTGALQALREELRYFPDNVEARSLLDSVSGNMPQLSTGDTSLDSIISIVEPYTMVGVGRLQALWHNAKTICDTGLPGNFVECGVAAGGTSGLLSAALLRYDASKARRLFSFDTFSGMPRPTTEDTHQGLGAQESGWGEGTCAAPQESLMQLARVLGTEHLIHPVRGFFSDTLPVTRESIGPIAFLHMDGDWYESTLDILANLYDQLIPGAYVQVDDYGHWEGCRKALHEFFDERGIKAELHPIDGTGVWFHVPLPA